MATVMDEQEQTTSNNLWDLDQAAQVTGVEKSRFKKHTDVRAVLQRMQEGVTIDLHIGYPRFQLRLRPEDLGLESSEEAEGLLEEYFHLGKRSLLPKAWRDRFQQVESRARHNLSARAFKSHWGYFVPTVAAKEGGQSPFDMWKEVNEQCAADFWVAISDLIDHYDEVAAQVIANYRVIARETYRRLSVERTLMKKRDDRSFYELVKALRSNEGEAPFVEQYITIVRNYFLDHYSTTSIRDNCVFEYEPGVISLPSFLAQDMAQADTITRDRIST